VRGLAFHPTNPNIIAYFSFEVNVNVMNLSTSYCIPASTQRLWNRYTFWFWKIIFFCCWRVISWHVVIIAPRQWHGVPMALNLLSVWKGCLTARLGSVHWCSGPWVRMAPSSSSIWKTNSSNGESSASQRWRVWQDRLGGRLFFYVLGALRWSATEAAVRHPK